MDVNEVLELAECYIYQLSEYKKLPNEINTIIKYPLPGRQVIPWEHNHTSTDKLYAYIAMKFYSQCYILHFALIHILFIIIHFKCYFILHGQTRKGTTVLCCHI